MIVHTGDEEGAAYVAARLRARLGVEEVSIVRAGPVFTAHVGRGCVAVAVHRLRA